MLVYRDMNVDPSSDLLVDSSINFVNPLQQLLGTPKYLISTAAVSVTDLIEQLMMHGWRYEIVTKQRQESHTISTVLEYLTKLRTREEICFLRLAKPNAVTNPVEWELWNDQKKDKCVNFLIRLKESLKEYRKNNSNLTINGIENVLRKMRSNK